MFLHQIIRGSRQHFLETKKIRREILLTSVDGPQHVSQLTPLFRTREQQPGQRGREPTTRRNCIVHAGAFGLSCLHGAC